MANHDFILKSGAKLHVTRAPFEIAVQVYEAVTAAARGRPPEEVIEILVTDPTVRRALIPAFEFATYNNLRLSTGLFDDPKVGDEALGDYMEICADLIEANCRPFFLRISSASSTLPKTTNASPVSP